MEKLIPLFDSIGLSPETAFVVGLLLIAAGFRIWQLKLELRESRERESPQQIKTTDEYMRISGNAQKRALEGDLRIEELEGKIRTMIPKAALSEGIRKGIDPHMREMLLNGLNEGNDHMILLVNALVVEHNWGNIPTSALMGKASLAIRKTNELMGKIKAGENVEEWPSSQLGESIRVFRAARAKRWPEWEAGNLSPSPE